VQQLRLGPTSGKETKHLADGDASSANRRLSETALGIRDDTLKEVGSHGCTVLPKPEERNTPNGLANGLALSCRTALWPQLARATSG
jgi:1,6-anhydro-N-acetylmuramate kinase